MTLVLDRHTSATHRLPDVRGWIEDAARILFKAWRDRRQAAILRDLDPTTRADIGYSCDYIRDDWQDFAREHMSSVAQPSNICAKRDI